MNSLLLLSLVIGVIYSTIKDIGDVKWPTLDKKPVKLMGHRGYKSQQPEHTLGSYWLAAINGMDYVEPDLVLTKDNIPVCYHDLYITKGTDILDRPEFFYKRRNYTGLLEGKYRTIQDEFFIADFTLKELQTLRVKQKMVGVRPNLYDTLFTIPSFQEFLDLISEVSYKLQAPINIVPELKHPNFHNKLFKLRYFEDKVLKILRNNGYPLKNQDQPKCKFNNTHLIPCGKVILQTFNFKSLQYIASKVDRGVVELVMLNDDNPYFFTRKGLKQVSKFASWFGPWKECLLVGPELELKYRNITWNKQTIQDLGGFISAPEMTNYAHQLNLKIVLYTFYDSHEPSYRNCAIKCNNDDLRTELQYYFKLGVDGLFVENANEAIQLRTEYHTELRLNVTRQ